MSFPDVPYDETLFESNELMRNYWDNATQKRAAIDQDESTDELYDLSIASFNDEQVVRLSTVEDSQQDKNVEPKMAVVVPQVSRDSGETLVKAPAQETLAQFRGTVQTIQLDPSENDPLWFTYLGIGAVILFLLYRNNKIFMRY